MKKAIQYLLEGFKEKKIAKSEVVEFINYTQQKTSEPKNLHPLLGKNTSDFSTQQFSSSFTGQEFFLSDHKVHSEKILPGVAYLEMARAACEIASNEAVIQLKNIVWASPIIVGKDGCEVKISLYPEKDHIAFEVHSLNKEKDPVIHSQGNLIIRQTKENEIKNIDIATIQTRCKKQMTAKECYAFLAENGLNYGPAFQGIKEMYVGAKEALAIIRLPEKVLDHKEPFKLHPSLMDAALQTTMTLNAVKKGETSLPFALSGLNISQPLPDKVYAYTKYSEGVDPAGKLFKYDIDIVDETGAVCVSFKSFTTRIFCTVEKGEDSNILYAAPEWREHEVKSKKAKEKSEIKDATVFLLGVSKGSENRLKKELTGLKIEQLNTKIDALTITKNFQTVFKCIKEQLESKSKEVAPILIVAQGQERRQSSATFSGLFKTARIENSRIQGKVIEIGSNEEQLSRIITEELEPETFEVVEVRYTEESKREVKKLKEIKFEPATIGNKLIKNGCVCWITGGLGGLGRIFAEYIGQTKDVKIILSGRSELDNAKHEQLEILKEAGIDAEYIQGDVCIKDDVKKIVKSIKGKHGQINGVIHTAGIIRDAFIIKKTEDEIEDVFKPKVSGILNIDEITSKEKLDFVALFSSITGAIGNVGQSDYAGANAFLDGYAEHRNELVKVGKRNGKTMSINWPLWKAGGMQIDKQARLIMKERLGMELMETKSGLDAFDKALELKSDQLFVGEGDLKKIRTKLFINTAQKDKAQTVKSKKQTKPGKSEKGDLLEKIKGNLVAMVSTLLKFNADDIDLEAEMSEYGFDSILLTELTNRINNKYGLELMPTIFFEHPTLESLSCYLAETYEDLLILKYHFVDEPEIEIEHDEVSYKKNEEVIELVSKRNRFLEYNRDDGNSLQNKTEGVAIIGMSGRFPGSPDLITFWKNLEANKDLITEIPQERWDWQEYWGDSAKEANKTKARWGGFIEDMDKFDPLFFNISPREAKLMDPQQRIFLQCVWEAIEDAGYRALDLSGTKTGVFAGVSTSDYAEILKDNSDEVYAQTSTGTVHSLLSNRISFLLNIHGSSESIDTACSSSLVAINRAVEGIQNGAIDMAICGGVNALLSPTYTISFSKAGMLSDDGRCKTFDKSANGYVRGEGVGAILLKSLSKAKNDSDHIYGVIKGSAENHGGRANSLTAPNPTAQKELLITAYQKAGFDPSSVGYIEAHGTGTELGDPIEINGLKWAFEELYKINEIPQPKHATCALGSAKTNIGHLEAGSGIAGVIKVLLAMKHGKLPGNAHLKEQNPYIDLKGSSFYLLRQTEEWKRKIDQNGSVLPRRAGVSSFGFGGTNAHIVIEEYIPEVAEQQSTPLMVDNRKQAIIPLSAKNDEQLKVYAEKLIKFLRLSDSVNIKAKRDVGSNSSVREAVKEEIREVLAKELNMPNEEIESEVAFTELGIGQVTLNRLHEELESNWSFIIEPKDVAGATSINSMSDLVCSKYKKELDSVLVEKIKNIKITTEPEINDSFSPASLTALAYTLQIGRQEMDARVAFIVENTKELIEKLESFVNENQQVENCYQGDTKKSNDTIKAFTVDENINEVIDKWISNGKVRKLAELWSKGLTFDWDLLYGENKPRRISAPTYPFARKRYWFDSHLKKVKVNNDKKILEAPEQGASVQVKNSNLKIETISNRSNITGRNVNKKVILKELSNYSDTVIKPNTDGLRKIKLNDLSFIKDGIQVPTNNESTALTSIGFDVIQDGVDCKSTDIDTDAIKRELKRQLSETLFIEESEIDNDAKFIDLGIDSILGVEWVKTINNHYELNIPATKVYDHPTISEFTKYLSSVFQATSSPPLKEDNQITGSIEKERASVESRVESTINIDVIKGDLKRRLSEALYIEESEIDDDAKFIDLGLDSILGVEFVKTINNHYHLNIAATKVYDHPSISEFSKFLSSDIQVGSSAPPLKEDNQITGSIEKERASVESRVESTINIDVIKGDLKRWLSEALYIEESEIDDDAKFMDLGLDSILGVEFVKTINNNYHLNIPATKVYDHPTISVLAKFIRSQITSVVSSQPAKEEKQIKDSIDEQLNKIVEQVYNNAISVETARERFLKL